MVRIRILKYLLRIKTTEIKCNLKRKKIFHEFGEAQELSDEDIPVKEEECKIQNLKLI